MAWKECGHPIYGWVTYHEEWIEDVYHPYVAYCYECTNHDKANKSKEKGTPWTLSVRCAYWANKSDPSSRCTNCWQICRIQWGSDQPLPSILGVGEEHDQTKLVLQAAREDRARISKPTRFLL